MRLLEILQQSSRLHAEARLRTDCVNGRYLMVHNVLAKAFFDGVQGNVDLDMPEYLSYQLTQQDLPVSRLDDADAIELTVPRALSDPAPARPFPKTHI